MHSPQRRSNLSPFPGSVLLYLEQYLKAAGGDVDMAYHRAGIDQSTFDPRQDDIQAEQFEGFLASVCSQSPNPALGLEVGTLLSISSFPNLGRAVMACENVGEAFQLAERYAMLTLPIITATAYRRDSLFAFEMSIQADAPITRHVLFDISVVFIKRCLQQMTGAEIPFAKVSFESDASYHVEHLEDKGVQSFELGARRNCIYVDEKYLATPFMMANPIDAPITLAQCEEELLELKKGDTIASRVAQRLRYFLETGPTIELIAGQLGMTERTLRRRLAAENSSFRVIQKQVRFDAACEYLSESSMTIEQIAAKIGYEESASFRAAFRTWAGVAPKQWRMANGRFKRA